jgi:RNA polymerase sigma factor (TIGR02999 family)
VRKSPKTLEDFFPIGDDRMIDHRPSDVTTVLCELHAGNPDAQDRLLNTVYDELRQMAAGCLRGERANHTLQPTALVNEFVLRLFRTDLQARDRGSFFALATKVMRRILAEHGRRRTAQKRGGCWQRVPLDDVADYFEREKLDVEAVDEALARLALLNQRQSEVITLRFFGGFTVSQIAGQLEVSVSTVESDLRLAKAWLRRQLAEKAP